MAGRFDELLLRLLREQDGRFYIGSTGVCSTVKDVCAWTTPAGDSVTGKRDEQGAILNSAALLGGPTFVATSWNGTSLFLKTNKMVRRKRESA